MAYRSESLEAFKGWLSEHGGRFNTSVQLAEGAFGISAIAQETVPADTTIVSCPFSLAITRDVALRAIVVLMGEVSQAGSILEDWSERQLICSYVCFHWLFPETSLPDVLQHLPYLKTLPSSEKLMTPLHFSPSELEAFKGSNIYGASIDREGQWRSEWTKCRDVIQKANRAWSTLFTWEHYLTASTYLSSRAFPSTLLSKNPSLEATPLSYPILLPGVDSLNHARGQPISWLVSHEGSTCPPEPSISLVTRRTTPAGHEIYNNYGPKPNSELILGYGFSLPQNPDDTILLRIGGSSNKWEIGRNARGAEGLWAEIVSLVAQDHAEPTFEDDLDAVGALSDMVETMMNHLPHVPSDDVEDHLIRPAVKLMLEHYVEGWREARSL
ncbi:SET domain-containing protein [Leucogyrophana mollusca]|uniref:SET domain-containing protein n=1 Tax=Leucogyrophana mollusca TaxID=85980 RepID=A0ACB8BGB4_9AGAM|nr:SET domain-containing protein [Leucogyrophana mollusca]